MSGYYMFIVSVGVFWSIWVILIEVLRFIKNGLFYLKSPTAMKYPPCVNESKYGKSCFKKIHTTKGNIKATTLTLHYIIGGEGNKQTMLFLHGFPEFWYSWRYQIEEFTKTHRVIAIDMRGYGKSDKPSNIADYQVIHIVNDLKALLDSLEIPTVTLVAHDWGGAVGWAFENCYPEMVEKYITLNIPHPSAFRKVLRSSMKQFLKSWYMCFFQLPFLPEWVFSRLNYESIASIFTSKKMGMQKRKLSVEEIEAFRSNMSQKGALEAAINYYRASPRYPPSNPKENIYRKENNRYMLIFGECDGAIEVAAAEETKALIPSLTLKLLPGLSHWVQQDDPDLVNSLIRNFIDEVDVD